MNKFRNIIDKYIKDSEKRKRYMAFLLSLSMLVMFFVPLGLTENADSMTIGSPGGAILTEQLKNEVNDSKLASGAIDLSNSNSGHYVDFEPTIMYDEKPVGDSQNIELPANMIFNIEYKLNNLNNHFNGTETGAHFYFPLNVKDEDSQIYQLICTTAYGTEINDYTYSESEPAGHFFVEGGYVYITLTSEYISYLNLNKGDAKGRVEFDGKLSSNGNEDGSCKIQVGNQEIDVSVKVPEKTVGNLEKSHAIVTAEDGTQTVNWEITLNKDAGLDLNGYTLTDTMFDEITSVTFVPANAGKFENQKVTFGNDADTKNATSVTIKYSTPLDGILDKVNNKQIRNEVKLLNSNNQEEKNTSSTIQLPTIGKQGSADYVNTEIDWTITVNNSAEIKLDGYTITDEKFRNASEIIVEYGGKKETVTRSGNTITLPAGIGTADSVTIKYSTPVTDDNIGKDQNNENKNKNTAILKKGNDTIDTATTNPEYKDNSALYNITKSGNYNADTGKITWTVEVRATENNMSLTGYKLVDSGKFENITYVEANNQLDTWVNSNDVGDYVEVSNKTITFKNNSQNVGLKRLKFTYTTDANPGDADKYVGNSIELDKPDGTTPVASTSVTVSVGAVRNTFTKSVDQTSVDIGKTNGTKNVKLHWTVNLISDNGFAGKNFDDTFEVPDGVTYKIENVKLYTKSTEHGNKTEITDTSKITIDGADITFGSEFNIPEHYIVLEYDTIVTLPAVTGGYDSNNEIKYQVSNSGSGSFGNGPGPVNAAITRKNPNDSSKAFTLRKQWLGTPKNVEKVYVYYTVRKGNDSNTTYYLKGTAGNYEIVASSDNATDLFKPAEQGGILYELNGSNTISDVIWKKDFTSLPTSKEIDGEVVTYYDYKVHEYSVVDKDNKEYKFDNNNYVKLDNGDIVVRSDNVCMDYITNTYYTTKNFKVKKHWDTVPSDVDSVTVQVQRKKNNENEWTDYGNSVTISKSEWENEKAITGSFPTAEIVNNEVVKYDYRLVETAVTLNNGTVIDKSSVSPNDQSKIIFINGNDYYETGNSVSANDNGLFEVTNTYHKAENISISATKKWVYNNNEYDSLDALRNTIGDIKETNLQSVKVKLERRVKNSGEAGWTDNFTGAEEKTISSNSTDALTWTGLKTQEVVEGVLVKYEYRVVECGFKTTYDDNANNKFNASGVDINFTGKIIAPAPDGGHYEIKYNHADEYITDRDGDNINITNTYVSETTTSITPQKNWKYEEKDKPTYNKPEYRADEVTFKLQQKGSKDHKNEWVDYEVNGETVTVTLKKSDNPNDNDNNIYSEINWDKGTVSPAGVDLNNLPSSWLEKTVSADETRKYETVNYSYRFVEISVKVNNTSYDVTYDELNTDQCKGSTPLMSFGNEQGKYEVTVNGGTVENKFKPNLGIEKYAVDSNANKFESLDVEELEQYKHTLKDGNEYYVFNYVIEYTKGEMKAIVDTFPEGFSLVEDFKSFEELGEYKTWETVDEKLSLKSGMNPTDGYWRINGCVNQNKEYPIADGYYASPMMFIISPFEAPPNSYLNKAEWGAYFGGWKNETERYSANQGDVFVEKSGKYNYNEANRVLSLGSVNLSNPQATAYVAYSVKILKSDLEDQLANAGGTLRIKNTAEKREVNGDKTGITSENTIVIKKPDNLINKEFAETKIPGQVKYTIDVNPEAKTLSNGSTVHITDEFATTGYTLRTNCSVHKGGHSAVITNGRMVDVLLNSLNVYAYDSNGNRTLLDSSEYNFVFKNGADLGNDKAAVLELNVPDSTHISIEYTYKLIANENTPSVIQGCKSTKIVKGKYPVMKSGMELPAGDKVSMRNKARLETDSNSAEKEKVVNNYEIAKSSGSISTTVLPKIQKVNIADQNINNLEADFYLAMYSEDEEGNTGWRYATKIEDKKVTWGNVSEKIPDDAYRLHLDGTKPYEVNLEDGIIYRLVEVKVPENYEGSDLKKLVDGEWVRFDDNDYEKLITNYLNDGTTEYAGTDYSNFLNVFVGDHYFLYNAIPTSDNVLKPIIFDASKVMQVTTGATVKVTNNELIDINVSKDWVGFDEDGKTVGNTSIILQLFWSEKNQAVIPDDATAATAENLGIMDYENFTPVVEVPYSTSAETVWRNLPNGHGTTPIYYYVKEIGYKIGEELYMLDESLDSVSGEKISSYKPATKYTVWKTDEEGNPELDAYGNPVVDVEWIENAEKSGKYYPTYVNNAVNMDSGESVEITNSNSFRLRKVWTDAENKVLPADSNKIDTDSIHVKIFGWDADGAKTHLFDATLTKENKWVADISDKVADINFDSYVKYTAEETGLPTGTKFITSVTFKINEKTGEIIVTNKNPDAVSASVSVNKVWSDGNDMHKSDSVEVKLYQIREDNITDSEWAVSSGTRVPTEDELISAGAVLYTTVADSEPSEDDTTEIPETQTASDNPVILNADNNWSHSWSGLPLEDEESEYGFRYVYYVVESYVKVANADKYTSKVTLVQNGSNYAYTVTNERPSITVKKEWYDENDMFVDAPVDSINVRLYKKGEVALSNTLKIQAYGDSITAGSGFNENGVSYADNAYLKNNLEANTIFKDKTTVTVERTAQGVEELDYISGKTVSSDINAICIMLGTNNILHKFAYGAGVTVNENGQNKSEDYEALIKSLSSDKSKPIFIATIPYLDYVDEFSKVELRNWSEYNTKYGVEYQNWPEAQRVMNAEIDKFNTYVRQVADSLNNDKYKVIVVDVNSALTENGAVPAKYYYDGCHLSIAGVQKMTDTFAEAITKYYTPKSYLKEDGTFTDNVAEAKTWTISRNGSWSEIIDLPAGFDSSIKLSVEEVENPALNNWKVSYDNNSQTSLSGEAIVVKNKYDAPKTNIEITKNWANDNATTDADLREKLAFTIFHSTTPENPDSWIEVEAEPVKTVVSDNVWKIVYNNLPAESPDGENYYYKIEEQELEGYTFSITKDTKLAVKDGTLSFSVTNTRSVSITVKKDWNDDKDHTSDSVTVRLWRSTNKDDVADLPLSLRVNTNSISMGVNSEQTITANRTDVEYTSSKETVATVDANGKVTAIAEGTAVITVKAGNETVEIPVTVVNFTMNVQYPTMKVGDSQTITLSSGGNSITGTFTSDSNILTVDNNGNVTANDVGTATITATCTVNGVTLTVSQTIEVGYPDSEFTLTGETNEIEIGGKLQLTPSTSFGTYEWSSSDTSKATVDANGLVTGVALGEVTITATRGDKKTASYTLNVVESVAFKLYLNGKDVTSSYPNNLTYFEVPKNSSLIFTSNKVIEKVETNDEYFLKVNGAKEAQINGKEFSISNGNINTAHSFDYVYFIVHYGNNQAKYIVHVVEEVTKPSINLSASSRSVTIGEEPQTVTITADPSDVTITHTELPDGVTYSNGVLTISPDAVAGTITFTATKEGYTNRTCTVKIKAQGSSENQEYTLEQLSSVTIDNYEDVKVIGLKVITRESDPKTSAFSGYLNFGGIGYEYSGNQKNNGWINDGENNIMLINVSGQSNGTVSINQYNAYPIEKFISVIFYTEYPIVAVNELSIFSLRPDSVSVLADEPTAQAERIRWTSDGNGKEYYEFVIKKSDNWEKTIENLEVGKNGRNYYYWVEETPVQNYDASYQYNDGSEKKHSINGTGGTVTIKNTPKTTNEGVEMPSTGGSGTNPYTTAGMIIAGGAVIALAIRRRKRKTA